MLKNKLSLLLLVLLGCFNLHAGKDQYKYPVRHPDTYRTPPKRQYSNYQQRQEVVRNQENDQEEVEASGLQPKSKKLMLVMLILPIIEAILRIYSSTAGASIPHEGGLPIYEIDFHDESGEWSCGRLQNDPRSYHCF